MYFQGHQNFCNRTYFITLGQHLHEMHWLLPEPACKISRATKCTEGVFSNRRQDGQEKEISDMDTSPADLNMSEALACSKKNRPAQRSLRAHYWHKAFDLNSSNRGANPTRATPTTAKKLTCFT